MRVVLPSNDVNKVGNTSSYYGDGDGGESSSSSSSSSCEATYGFLPCTDTILGNLFLLVVYGYLLFVAAQLLSEGSELLLTVLDAGIIGGLLLPILGALPDAILILGTHTRTNAYIYNHFRSSVLRFVSNRFILQSHI